LHELRESNGDVERQRVRVVNDIVGVSVEIGGIGRGRMPEPMDLHTEVTSQIQPGSARKLFGVSNVGRPMSLPRKPRSGTKNP